MRAAPDGDRNDGDPVDDVAAVLLDIDGVLVDDWRPIAGAPEAVAGLRAAGLPLAFLTNTTTRSRDGVVAALRDAGIEVAPAEVTTAAVATARHLAEVHAGDRCLVLNHGEGTADLGDVDLVDEHADVVVVGSAGPDAFAWDRCNAALSSLLDGAALVGMHRSLKWRSAGRWRLDGGAYLRALEEAAGVEATVLGKPAPAVFVQVCRELDTEPARCVMVGDSIGGDVLAARAAGLRGVLVRTGGYRAADVAAADGEPDATIDSVRDLPGLLGIR